MPGSRQAARSPWLVVPAALVLNTAALAVTTATRSIEVYFGCAVVMAAVAAMVASRAQRSEKHAPHLHAAGLFSALLPALVFTVAVQLYAAIFLLEVPEDGAYPSLFSSQVLEAAATTGGQIAAALAIAFVLQPRAERDRQASAPVELQLSGLLAILAGVVAAVLILLPIWGPAVYATALGVMVASILASFALILSVAWQALRD